MFRDRNVHAGVFPISIEPQKFIQGMERPEVKPRTAALAQQHRDKKTIIGVDGLDFTKGTSPKFNALELFLGKHTEWVGKPRLQQIPTPTLHAPLCSAGRTSLAVCRFRRLLCLVDTRWDESGRMRMYRHTKRQTWCTVALGISPVPSSTCRVACYAIRGTPAGW